MTILDRYAERRRALRVIVDEIGRGGRVEVANKIGRSASYVSRLLYPPTKDGAKNIGDELVEAITKAYPDWLDRGRRARDLPGLLPAAAAAPAGAYIAFDAFIAPDGATAKALPDVARRLELATWEVQRRMGFLPEPGRIQLFTQLGPSMRPMLEEGDVAFIDTSVTALTGDDCYLIGMGGDVQVKLLQRRGPELWVVSQNPDFPAWRVADEADITIHGRVVMRGSLRST
ncbi:MAG TPA: S24 family peptidase [Luteimonas sp.]